MLPNLAASKSSSSNHFHCILPENAFDTSTIESSPIWMDRFGPGSADVVVGNPPWGKPGQNADETAKARHQVMLNWCDENENEIGDQEPSQAFLLRALDLLKPNGKAGMLVSAGILFKHSPKTKTFRTQWLSNSQVSEVFNFTHVRKYFFKATSPFLAIVFCKSKQKGKPVLYGSAKQTLSVARQQAVMFSRHDLHWLRNEDLTSNTTWKTYWFGTFADRKLIKQLTDHLSLDDIYDHKKSGAGYKIGNRKNDFFDLQGLDHESFSRYAPLAFKRPTSKAERTRSIDLYVHPRLIVKRGVDQKSDDKGQIIAQYSTKKFAFHEWFYGVQFVQPKEWMYKTILGLIWSSLSRYYLFMTSSQWGLWYDNIHFGDELLRLPIVLNQDSSATKKVIALVDKLRGYHPQERNNLNSTGLPKKKIEAQRRKWEQQLDEAVFELYGLSEEQKDLIRDCCEVTLPFFYKPFDSIGTTLAVDGGNYTWMEQYTRIFARRWQPYLGDNEDMRAELHLGAHGNMVAVEFYPADNNDLWDLVPRDDWGYVLEQLSSVLPIPMGTSQIVLDGMVHVVSNRGIIIIKRNEKRLWTRSLAREDADSTLAKQMVQTMPRERGMD